MQASVCLIEEMVASGRRVVGESTDCSTGDPMLLALKIRLLKKSGRWTSGSTSGRAGVAVLRKVTAPTKRCAQNASKARGLHTLAGRTKGEIPS